jgi:hypothetical protein
VNVAVSGCLLYLTSTVPYPVQGIQVTITPENL